MELTERQKKAGYKEVLEVSQRLLADIDHWKATDGKILISGIPQMVFIGNPAASGAAVKIPQIIDEDAEAIKVSQKGGRLLGSVASTADPADIPVPTGERWFVETVLLDCVVDATVIARTFNQQILMPTLVPSAITVLFQSGDITLTASEEGHVYQGHGPETWLHDAGVITNETTNPFPSILEAGSIIRATITANNQVGDRLAGQVWGRKIT